MADTQADLESCMRSIANRSAGSSDMEVIQEAANIRNRSPQDNAMCGLQAYSRIDRDDVNAAMAKHDFKNLCAASN